MAINRGIFARPADHLRRVLRLKFLVAQPERLLDFFIKKFLIYASYVFYYPYWVWRNKSVRNGIFWFAILSAAVAEYFGVAALLSLLGMAGQFALAAGYMVFQFAIMFIFLSSTKNVELLPGDVSSKTFAKDWFGQKHIKDVVLGTFEMMSADNQEKMKALGATPPSGALLTGPPGTGKTLIAQCSASEISIPYIGLNGADLNAMFVGVGEMKVKSLYAKARRWANQYGGCVVFIDEIDAATSSRGGVEGEEEQGQVQRGGGGGLFGGGGMGIRSQLLTAMDGSKDPHIRTDLINIAFRFFGFEEIRDGVVFWLGATNRKGEVDPGFLRPGRLGDTIIQMDPPDKGSRRKIIQGYVNRITTDSTVDVEILANDTQGITPADIAGAFERVAARFTLKDGRTAISMVDIQAAVMEQEFGIANPIAEWEEGQKEQVATHEAGHAIAIHLLMKERRITNLSIIRRGKGTLGFVRKVSPDEIYAMPLEDLCAQIQVSWAGDIACEMIMGKRWTGGLGGDFKTIDMLMRSLAGHGYFADKLPRDPTQPFADEDIKKAADRYEARVKESMRAMVLKHREVIQDWRDALLDKGELNSAEVYETLEARGYEPV